ncbi:MAG: hypothetical protein ABI824_16785 [Acidobacteriota bacterium]
MNDTQILTIALASAPTMLTVLIGILVNNSRLSDLRAQLSDLRAHVDVRFSEADRKYTDLDRKMDRRFDEMRDLWRSELHRVEEVLDARLKHLEER